MLVRVFTLRLDPILGRFDDGEVPDWRNQQAREEGVPPYVICTNRQLAAITHDRPASLSKLGMVEGLGRAKLERYGGFILRIVEPEHEPERETPPCLPS